ncbi:DUF732 domain-containing protein [Mycobacterium sp. NPDC051804]|uniref:DUF732 domain-containing protein n=1 Tax=Mycobacterium sp. NPDC051804 TaxID=3364295 RepID=UPI0037B89946
MKILVAAALASSIALTSPPSAHADEDVLVELLQTRYVFLSRDQILEEGHKVCQLTQSGRSASSVVPDVVEDLGISVAAAAQFVATAVVELEC